MSIPVPPPAPASVVRFEVRAYEVGPSGQLSPLVLCDYLQESAGMHARALGVEFPSTPGGAGVWVLGRLRVAIDRLPAHGDVVEVETWPAAEDGVRAERDYIVRLGDEVFARGVSEWIILDLARRRPARLPAEVRGIPLPDRPRALEPADEPAPPPRVEHTAGFPVRRRDLDRVGHANNVRFVEWALESVPDALAGAARLVGIDIRYHAQAVYGDVVNVDVGPTGEGMLAHHLHVDRDDVTVAVARTAWAVRAAGEEPAPRRRPQG